jgi:regulator of cell morphogenesis and NO signaling
MKTCVTQQTDDEVLPAAARPSRVAEADMSLVELVDHIVMTHHAYLHEALPSLARMASIVAARHGAQDPRLHQVRDTFGALALELWQHMLKEETCLFPRVRQLDAGDRPPELSGLMLANPIRQMESEHGEADCALERLRELTDGFVAPGWASDAYRSFLAALAFFEEDLHLHIHKENDVLFPRALNVEAGLGA